MAGRPGASFAVAAILATSKPTTILIGTYTPGDMPATSPNEELGPTMAVPKRRMSRANTRSRRAQWKATRTELVGVTVAGQKHKVPRRLLKAARLGLIDLDRR